MPITFLLVDQSSPNFFSPKKELVDQVLFRFSIHRSILGIFEMTVEIFSYLLEDLYQQSVN